jgi:hypothetical protein
MADIDKGLYQAPLGMEQTAQTTPAMEIQIEDPESVHIGMDGMEIEIGHQKETSEDFNDNLAEHMDEGALAELAGELMGDFDADISSRKDWLDTYVDGLELLGLKTEDRTEPWPGACNVYHPILSEALVKFQAETMMETFPAMGPVKTQIIGKQTPEKEESALRVKDDMNYQLTEEMPEYRPEHERMLWGLGLAGNAFKKVYFDPALDRQVALFVPAEDIVVPYGASSLEVADRVTHVMRKTKNEMRKLQVGGFYRDIDLGEPLNDVDEVEQKIAEKMGFNATSDDRYKILEMHVNLDLEGFEDVDEKGHPTGIALPYVVTLERGTNIILSIRRNWDPEDERMTKRQHFVHYGYIPGFGFYCFGLIHLIGAFAKSGTMILRQLVDAGTLSNLPGGMKSRGLRIKGDDTPIAPGEWRDVDVPSGAIRDNILPLPYKEPSQTLAALMDKIIEEGRAFANAADMKVSDMSANSPVGTTLAILERTLKVMSAVQARIHYAMKQEFKLLAGIIRDYTPEDYNYDPEVGDRKAKKSDYDCCEVIPVSDPNAATMSQKVVQYQAVMQMAAQSPQIYDQVELNKQMLEVLGVKNIGKLIPAAEDQKPKDPVTENMAIINGKPVKAFIHQDHQAHIGVHMAAMQDPKLMQMMSQNPQAQMIQAAAMAHINEHLAFEYRKQIQDQLGTSLPSEKDELAPELEVELSKLIAQAAQQLLQKNQAEAQQQQAQQQAQDPLIQMQQAEIQIKQQEVQIKAQESQAKIQLEQQRLELEKAKMESNEKIKGAEIGSKVTMDKQKLQASQVEKGIQIGMEAEFRRKEHGHKENQQGIDAIDKLAGHTQQHLDRVHAAGMAGLSHAQQASMSEQQANKKEVKPRKKE